MAQAGHRRPREVEEGIGERDGDVQASNRLENSPAVQAEGAKFELRRGIIIEPARKQYEGQPKDGGSGKAGKAQARRRHLEGCIGKTTAGRSGIRGNSENGFKG